MNDKLVLKEELLEKEHIASVLKELLSEKTTDRRKLNYRWETGFNMVFSYLSKLASSFFVSKVKGEDAAQAQSYIRHFFRKTDYIETVKNDASLQKAFLFGYFHGVECLMTEFERAISFEQNHSLKSVISSYKYVEPILQILDVEVEISHKELAQLLDISESALSNVMNKVQNYNIFHSMRVGKNKYYSLAYPNGEEALKIIKGNTSIPVQSYTDFLLELLDTLRKVSIYNELDEKYVMERCGKMMFQYTLKPSLCKKKLKDIVFFLKSERLYCASLMKLEMGVSKKVTVMTKSVQSEECFRNVIITNLIKNVAYRWFFAETDDENLVEKIRDFSKIYFSGFKRACVDKKSDLNARCYIVPKEKVDIIFGSNYDMVIYDEEKGFCCEEKNISEKTLYNPMSEHKVSRLKQSLKEEAGNFYQIEIGGAV